jgi:polyphosphate kinase
MSKKDENPKRKSLNIGHPTYYINRELSMLAFQQRVLDEAKDQQNPLLERIKFLAIVGNNMDEFFMVRVGGLKMQNDAGVVRLSIDGKSPAEQLASIRSQAYDLMADARELWKDELLPALNQAGIHILDYEQLSDKQRENVDEFFHEVIFPVLTPLAFDPGHPFPHISNLSLNLAVLIQDEKGRQHFARLKVPATFPRLVPIKRSSGGHRVDGTVPHHHYFVWLEQLIAANLPSLFPGMEVLESYPFRATRNADMVIQELEASDLLETMEESVRRRRFGSVVRLTVTEDMPAYLLNILISNLDMDDKDVYRLQEPMGLSQLMELHRIDRFDLKDKPFLSHTFPPLRVDSEDGNIFAAIRQEDILLHHPYDSFDPIINFLRIASRDPNVLAIKQTLYRVGKNSPVVDALLEARRDHGKQVAVLVELKARFDEESNIEWAKMLEREGVHVTYGLLGLKTHSKVILVVRRENDRIRRYIHLGTGNYNHITARTYEDIGMFTCDEQIGEDVTDLFNYLTGYSSKKDYRKLLVAPINLRERMEELIRREMRLAKKGEGGRLIFKTNALVDKPFIKLLYQASNAGVKIDLIVRSMCSLRPGIPGLSENINVISVVGRFLEHSRIYYFHNGGDEEVYMGSADLMPRNLDDRVEVLFPVRDQRIINSIRDNILMTYLADNLKARQMESNGDYRRRTPEDKDELSSQAWFLRRIQMGEFD